MVYLRYLWCLLTDADQGFLNFRGQTHTGGLIIMQGKTSVLVKSYLLLSHSFFQAPVRSSEVSCSTSCLFVCF